jgi:DNA-binding GntR family transcriptional regulator
VERVEQKNKAMAKAYFVVRAEVFDEADRASFDHWYATDHLPLAIRTFAAERGWRCWSRTDPAVHYAFYEFADVQQAQALLDWERIRPLVADFDRVWGNRVARRREILEIVQEITP